MSYASWRRQRIKPDTRDKIRFDSTYVLEHKTKTGGVAMKKSLFASIVMVLIGRSFASSVIADDTLVRFKGAIGDLPVANVAGTPNPDGTFPDRIRDIVRGVHPPPPNLVSPHFQA